MRRFFEDFMVDHVSEMVFFLFKIGESMLEPSVRLYLYEGVCLSLLGSVNGSEQCSAQEITEENYSMQSFIQDEASKYLVAYKILMNAPALFLGFFCGSWSDVIGRRIPVLLSLIATAAAVLLYAVSMWVDLTGRGVPAVPLVLLGALVRGGVGRSAVLTMALYSLVCDQTSKVGRTKKIGRLLSMSYFGYFLGSLTAAGLLESYGFDIIFVIVLCVDIVAIVIVVLFMEKDIRTKSASSMKKKTECIGLDEESSEKNDGGKESRERKESCVEEQEDRKEMAGRMMPFRISHVISSVQVLTRKRQSHARLHVLVFLFTLFVNQTCRSGESDVTLLFAEVPPLSWRKSMYAYLLATDYALLGLSVLVLLPVLIRFFKFTDCNLIILGLSFRILRLLILSFSKSTFEVFLSTILGAPSALIVSCCKASISKIVEDNERGKVFALISCAETVAILTGSIIFVSVYNATKHFFSGSVFVFEALFFAFMLALIYMVGRDMKEAVQYDEMNSLPDQNFEKQESLVLNSQTPSANAQADGTLIVAKDAPKLQCDSTQMAEDPNTSLLNKNKPSNNPFYNPEFNK